MCATNMIFSVIFVHTDCGISPFYVTHDWSKNNYQRSLYDVYFPLWLFPQGGRCGEVRLWKNSVRCAIGTFECVGSAAPVAAPWHLLHMDVLAGFKSRD